MEPMQIACMPFVSSALTVAARLGIADLVHTQPQTADELAAATSACAPVLQRILRLLAGVGIFQKDEHGRYVNSRDSEPLRTDHPASVRRFCILAGSEYYRAFGDLIHTAQTGEPAFVHMFGGSIYDYMDKNPEAGGIYDLAMEDLARPVGRFLAGAIDFSGFAQVVDVGGGAGALLKGLLRAAPHLTGLCLDRADVCQRGAARVAEPANADLQGRLSFQPGDFFAAVPADADVYLLKNVLHNWNNEACARILRVIREALKPRARLFVIEMLLDDKAPTIPRLMDDLFQITICQEGTTARTEDGFRAVLREGGLDPIRFIPLATGHTVIETVPLH